METPIDWQAEARKMRAKGHDAGEIAMALGQAAEEVREVLKGARRQRQTILGAGATMVEPHVVRTPRVVLDRAALQAAAVAFAAGEIDRTELMRRITPTMTV